VAVETTLGAPRCDGEVFDRAEAEGDTGAPVELGLTLDDGLSDGQEWLLLGAICRDGTPRFSTRANVFECADGAPQEFFLRTEVNTRDANENPDLTDDELRYDGSLWQPVLD